MNDPNKCANCGRDRTHTEATGFPCRKFVESEQKEPMNPTGLQKELRFYVATIGGLADEGVPPYYTVKDVKTGAWYGSWKTEGEAIVARSNMQSAFELGQTSKNPNEREQRLSKLLQTVNEWRHSPEVDGTLTFHAIRMGPGIFSVSKEFQEKYYPMLEQLDEEFPTKTSSKSQTDQKEGL